MRRADRLFEIIQILRTATKPVTADELAERLEVTPRTIYRDMAAMQAQRVPIEGEAGIGYVMRPGYDLPPLMFTLEEVEAISVGLAMLERTADCTLRNVADSIVEKIGAVLPCELGGSLRGPTTVVTNWPLPVVRSSFITAIRHAIREERKLLIDYRNENGRDTARIIRPLALVYCADVILIAAWCELREGFRHFRADRIAGCTATDEWFRGKGDALRAEWEQAERSKKN